MSTLQQPDFWPDDGRQRLPGNLKEAVARLLAAAAGDRRYAEFESEVAALVTAGFDWTAQLALEVGRARHGRHFNHDFRAAWVRVLLRRRPDLAKRMTPDRKTHRIDAAADWLDRNRPGWWQQEGRTS